MVHSRKIPDFVSLMFAALSTGVFFGTRVSLGPSTKRLTPSSYVEVQQETVRNLRPVMGVLLPASVASNAAVTYLRRGDRKSARFAWSVAALTAQVTALIVTAAVELPINAEVLTWTPERPPPGWMETRDRWARAHTARTVSSLLGLTCLLAAALPGAPANDQTRDVQGS